MKTKNKPDYAKIANAIGIFCLIAGGWLLWEFRPLTLGEIKAHETGHVIGFWHSEIPVKFVEARVLTSEGETKISEITGSLGMMWRFCAAVAAGPVAQERHSGRTRGSASDYEKLESCAEILIRYSKGGYLPPMPWDRETRLPATVENVVESSRERAKAMLAMYADEFDKVFEALDARHLSHDQIAQLLGPQRVD